MELGKKVIELMKNNKPKNPNHKGGCGHCSELIIDEPVIKLV